MTAIMMMVQLSCGDMFSSAWFCNGSPSLQTVKRSSWTWCQMYCCVPVYSNIRKCDTCFMSSFLSLVILLMLIKGLNLECDWCRSSVFFLFHLFFPPFLKNHYRVSERLNQYKIILIIIMNGYLGFSNDCTTMWPFINHVLSFLS